MHFFLSWAPLINDCQSEAGGVLFDLWCLLSGAVRATWPPPPWGGASCTTSRSTPACPPPYSRSRPCSPAPCSYQAPSSLSRRTPCTSGLTSGEWGQGTCLCDNNRAHLRTSASHVYSRGHVSPGLSPGAIIVTGVAGVLLRKVWPASNDPLSPSANKQRILRRYMNNMTYDKVTWQWRRSSSSLFSLIYLKFIYSIRNETKVVIRNDKSKEIKFPIE